MILTCPNCDSRFVLPDHVLGEEGRKVRCSSCSEVWFQGPDGEVSEEISQEDIEQESESPDGDIPLISEEGSESDENQGLDAGLAEPDLDNFGPQEEDDNVNEELKTLSAEVTKKIAGYLAAFLVFIVTLLLFLALHGGLANSWKGTQTVYQWFGFPIESPAKALVFDGVSVKVAPEGEGEKVVLTGNIRNLSDKKVRLPNIQASLRNAEGVTIESWILKLPHKDVKSEEAIAFEDEHIASHKGSVDVRLRFVLDSKASQE